MVLLNLGGIDLALDNVEDGDEAVVALAVARGRDHHVLRLHSNDKIWRYYITLYFK